MRMESTPKKVKIRLVRDWNPRPFKSSQTAIHLKGLGSFLPFLLKLQRLNDRNKYDNDFNQWTAPNKLKELATTDGKRIVEPKELGLDWDAVEFIIDDDYIKLPGPIAVESKNTFDNHSLFFRISSNIYYFLANSELKSAVFYIYDTLGNVNYEDLRNRLNERFAGIFNILIIDAENYTGLRINRPLAELVGTIFEPFVGTVGNHELQRYEEYFSEERVVRAAEAISNSKVTVFLGAGVSSSMGFPNWSQLIEFLWWETARGRAIFEKVDDNFVISKIDEIIGDSLLIKARMLQSTYGDTLMWRLRDLLYPVNCSESSLMAAVSEIIVKLKLVDRLSQIMTLNYDNTIEISLSNRGLEAKPFYGADNTYNQELRIFHVHGYLPPKPELLTVKETESVVFSESAYNMLANDSYAATNVRVIQRLIDDICIFVGHSMTDPNIRRLLEVSQKIRKGRRHYWFKRLDDIDMTNNDKNIMLHRIVKIQEAMMSTFGINVIWYKNHSDLPAIIRKITSLINE